MKFIEFRVTLKPVLGGVSEIPSCLLMNSSNKTGTAIFNNDRVLDDCREWVCALTLHLIYFNITTAGVKWQCGDCRKCPRPSSKVLLSYTRVCYFYRFIFWNWNVFIYPKLKFCVFFLNTLKKEWTFGFFSVLISF